MLASTGTLVPLLLLPAPPARAASIAPAPSSRGLRLHPAGDPSRAEVERFVAEAYARRYGARIPAWAPMLASWVDDDGIAAAAGWRGAAEPLYLERYLDGPVEARIAERTGRPAPPRARIVEVGHLAAARPGASRRLMTRLAAHLASLGYRWVVSTATPGVRAGFERLGVRVVELGEARAQAVGEHAPAWGRYYERGPSVVAGEIVPNLARALARASR